MKTLTVLLTALLLSGCASSPTTDAADLADVHYEGDLDARNVPTGITNGAPAGFGHALCSDMSKGADAGGELMSVANLQENHMDKFTLPQAEIITYWAIYELCPEYKSQLRETWKDGS